MSFNPKQLENFPNQPGVYLMKDAQGTVLYIGKAKILKARIKQYFAKGRDGRPIIPYLVEKISDIETIVVFSEKEALLLEDTLIKKHQPQYNALLKDDKSYISLKINHKHEWPMIQLVRYKGSPPSDGLYFGPYMNVGIARHLLETVNKLFPLRRCSDKELKRGKPCFFYQIKRCPGPCAGVCTHEEYDKNVKRTIQFLKGQDKEVLKSLYLEMEEASTALDFETAGNLLIKIRQIENALESQYVHQILHRDCDAIGFYRQGEEVLLTQLIFRGGKLVGSQSFNFSEIVQEDDEIIESFLVQHYRAKADLPSEILVPISLKKEVIEEVISENKKRYAHILSPKRGNKLSILEMAQNNAKATFEKVKNSSKLLEKTLFEIQEKLRLKRYPKRIECFDNSHLSGSNSVASMVVFINGEKTPSEYRKYHIKTAGASDDYGAFKEILKRRYQKAITSNNLPDLILIDGGKGQLNVAYKILKELDIPEVDLVAVAKEEGRHDKGTTQERLFVYNVKDPIALKRNSSILFFIQTIRDEAHRFAISFQRKLQRQSTLKSQLQEIPGIGPIKLKRLLTFFGSVKRIKQALIDELRQVKGISDKDAVQILKFLKQNSGD